MAASLTARPSCDQVLKACDKAVTDLNLALDAKTHVISTLEQQVIIAKRLQADAEADAGRFYRNPFIMGTFGFAIGVLAGIYAAKR